MNAHDWIEHLDLKPHPEGGFYRETYRAEDLIPSSGLPPRFTGPRTAGTAIFYLLERGDFSAFHRIKSDEVWHFYGGDPLEIHVVNGANYSVITLGADPRAGGTPQTVVPHGAWFAARLKHGGAYALVGCTVSPGFDFEDFEMGAADEVLKARPDLVERLSDLFR